MIKNDIIILFNPFFFFFNYLKMNYLLNLI